MTNAPDDTLQSLADKQALLELVLTYCRAIDRRDYALLLSLYHEDAVEERGAIFSGTAREFVAWVQKDSVNYAATMHRLSNTLFTVHGDTAEGEHYAEAYHRTLGDTPMEVTAAGRYLDRYERRDGRWAIAYRTSTLDRCDMRPVNSEAYSQFVAGSVVGQPGADDLSYQVLSTFNRHPAAG
ncbi:MAG: nuclear transport factor 2 family protein [Porticoccaceae bacterium]